MAQTLSDIKQLLQDRGVRPVHRLGQNFLHDSNKLAAILAAASLTPDRQVLEVGPGTGVLTEAMLEAGSSVTAVEIDATMINILRDRIGADRPGWQLLHTDILTSKHQIAPAVEEAIGGRDKPFCLIANLPYQIASPLIAILLTDWPGLHRAVVMVQKEVADRLSAPPGGKDYGPLGILVQAMAKVRIVTTLPPGCFWPKPKISSAVVQIDRRTQPLTGHPQQLRHLLHVLFTKRRKQIGSILGRDIQLPKGITPTMRPEQIDVAQLCEMAESLKLDHEPH